MVDPTSVCRESRYFSTWKRKRHLEEYQLPEEVRQAASGQQKTVPFGDAVLCFEDAILGVETCEELFTPAASSIDLALSGVEIISNSSGSHHQVSSRSHCRVQISISQVSCSASDKRPAGCIGVVKCINRMCCPVWPKRRQGNRDSCVIGVF